MKYRSQPSRMAELPAAGIPVNSPVALGHGQLFCEQISSHPTGKGSREGGWGWWKTECHKCHLPGREIEILAFIESLSADFATDADDMFLPDKEAENAGGRLSRTLTKHVPPAPKEPQ